MIIEQKHIINKVFLEVNTNSKKVAYDFKDNLGLFLKQEIFPFIEAYFNDVESKLITDIVQISKLNLELTVSSNNNFNELKHAIKQQFIKEIKKTIATTTTKSKETVFISNKENRLKTFFYFLEKGLLPWNSEDKNHNIFSTKEILKIVKTNQFRSLFQHKIKSKIVQKRLINQFEINEIEVILKHGFKNDSSKIKILNIELLSEIKKLNNSVQKLIWQDLIDYFITNDELLLLENLGNYLDRDNLLSKLDEVVIKVIITNLFENLQNITSKKNIINPDFLELSRISSIKSKIKNSKKELFENIILSKLKIDSKNNLKDDFQNVEILKNMENITEIDLEAKFQNIETLKRNAIKTKIDAKDEFIKNDKEIKLIKDKTFFTDKKSSYYVDNTGLILLHPFLTQFFENCKLLDKDYKIINIELAIHVLHYVATKREKQFENNLVFEKFLCGVPINQPINRNVVIPKSIKEQVEDLLNSVIQNWEVLKNSSTELLCNEFLQRSGKLSFKGDKPKITIERKTQDILIDKLPWNIGICKLPWLDKLIFTDW